MGTSDAIGADGRSTKADAVPFETAVADQTVTFTVDPLAGRVQVTVEAPPPVPGPDGEVWWDGLGHNTRQDRYRVPWGAVPIGTPVILRFRSYHGDLTAVSVRVWSTAVEAQTLHPMERVATTEGEPYPYDWWQATLPPQDAPTILWYRFIVRDGVDEDYYEDDDLLDGGWGLAYDESPDYSFQIDVYDAGFQTPDWMKNAVVYQIFPDRFFNGDSKNDAQPSDPAVYDHPVRVTAWDGLPEGHCRGYEAVDCAEEPLGRDFFGGDLQGIKDKLDYLAGLGVTALYLNPIFEAPSNHLYDTSDYLRIDPYFGSRGTFASLVREAGKHGIRILLDGVFNHTSSDSVYFDRYSRYPQVGAYESQDSPYYEWYTFSDWPDGYDSWWGFDSLPVLTEAPAVRELIYGDSRSVARWWLSLGASGWRLDVAPDKSHDFWRGFRPQVKAADSEAILVGEIWDDASPWLLGNELDTAMNYRFRRALLGFLNGDASDPNQGTIRGLNPDQFDSVLQSIKEDYPPPAYGTAMNLVGSHDTQRILWALTPGARNREDKEYNAANLAEGKAKLKLLAILQMTMPGAPTIYYGDEVGLTGDTDPDDRRPFPWDGIDPDLLSHYQALTGLRNEHSFLRTGSFDRLYTHNDHGTYAYGRKDPAGAAVIAVNRDTAAHDLAIDLAGYLPEGTGLTDALNGGSYSVTDGQVTLGLDPRWGAVLITAPGTDLTPPRAPQGLQATAGDGRVDLAWQAVSGAAGYHVYRSPLSGGGYVRLNGDPLPAPAYADEAAVNGRLAYYVVTAVDASGNESDRSTQVEALPQMLINWANLQRPPSIEHTLSALEPTAELYGQVWIEGHTDQPGPTEGLIAQLGYGREGSPPEGNPQWIWVDALFHGDDGDNDQFVGQLLPEAPGTYHYAYRYSTTAGRTWLYADLDGSENGYDPAQAGNLTVVSSGDTTPSAAPTNLHLVGASSSHLRLAWNEVPDADLYRYELYRRETSGEAYIRVATALAPATETTDWGVTAGSTYTYVVRATDISFNESGDSNQVQATAHARPVDVTFRVTLPETTPPGEDVYLAGSFNGWDPAGTLLARTGLSATGTLTFDEGTQLQYRYTRDSWDSVEKGAACEEIADRAATVVYGADGAMTIEDEVLNWRNTGTCGD
jgi:glycosidase